MVLCNALTVKKKVTCQENVLIRRVILVGVEEGTRIKESTISTVEIDNSLKAIMGEGKEEHMDSRRVVRTGKMLIRRKQRKDLDSTRPNLTRICGVVKNQSKSWML